jgi:hypothetical protein
MSSLNNFYIGINLDSRKIDTYDVSIKRVARMVVNETIF